MPLVSVILPTYNRKHFLSRALDSVLSQTFGDFELIVIDDGSTDDSQSLLEDYRDPRLVFRKQENQGVSQARNLGIKMATGEWIAFLDSDDFWLPQKLEKQVGFFRENPEARICQVDEIWIRKGVRVNPHKKHQKKSGWIFEDCLPLCVVSPSAVMIHKSVFDNCGLFDSRLPACEDYDLWLRMSLAYPIYTLSDKLIVKNGGHADQLSQRYWGMDRFRVYALQKIVVDPRITLGQKEGVVKMIEKKRKILEIGAMKRGRTLEDVLKF